MQSTFLIFYILVKVNYRHQLCAANFATLQLCRGRSLSGNCRRQSRRRKFGRVAVVVRVENRISKIHRNQRFFHWKLSQARG